MRTVLIVDDEDGVIYCIEQTLAELNYRLITTTSPHRALQILQSDASIDLLITDLFMPAMDGAVLLDRSRRLRPGLRAVLTTGVASDQQMRRWRARGELVVSKPWLDKEFLDVVNKALMRAT